MKMTDVIILFITCSLS